MSQQEFGDWLGYSKNHISKMERGERPIPKVLEMAIRNDKSLEVDLDMDLMNEVCEYAKEEDISFANAFFKLVKKGMGLLFLGGVGYFLVKNPEQVRSVLGMLEVALRG